MKPEIKIESRKAAFMELHQLCIMSNSGSADFMEVTEWSNGEGYDITINASNQEQTFHLTWGQLKALKKLVKALENN